ncbi:MAG: hypothetical protein AAF211_11505 [Myxococcota bacterium]
MPKQPKVRPDPSSLPERRKAAQKALWWRAQIQGVWHSGFLVLLALDGMIAAWLVLSAATESSDPLDLTVRLFGDAEEAAWLGWLTYFGWLFFDRMNRARKKRRSARLARLLLRRGHPRWFYALSSS